MTLDITLLGINDYDLDSLVNSLNDEEKFWENYLSKDKNEFSHLGFSRLDSYENTTLLAKYLFENSDNSIEIFQNNKIRIIDLTGMKSNVTTFEKLKNWYQDWIHESKRENSMDEYGQLIGLISYIQSHQDTKYLLMIIRSL